MFFTLTLISNCFDRKFLLFSACFLRSTGLRPLRSIPSPQAGPSPNLRRRRLPSRLRIQVPGTELRQVLRLRQPGLRLRSLRLLRAQQLLLQRSAGVRHLGRVPGNETIEHLPNLD